jgi:high-affinity K+ transport system ATPase subunit B
MMGNPVMFVVEIGSVITTVLLFKGGAVQWEIGWGHRVKGSMRPKIT